MATGHQCSRNDRPHTPSPRPQHRRMAKHQPRPPQPAANRVPHELGPKPILGSSSIPRRRFTSPRTSKLQPNPLGYCDIGIFRKASDDSLPPTRPWRISGQLCRMGARSPSSRGPSRPRACRRMESAKQATQPATLCPPSVHIPA